MQLSNSTLQTYKTCMRKWWLLYVRRLSTPPSRQVPTGVAELGTRVHLALEAHYGHDLDPISVLGLVYDWAIAEFPSFEPELTKEHSYAKVMVEGYLEWSAEEGIDVGLDIIATERIVEHQVELPSGRSVTLVGKLDQTIKRDVDNAILFRDWKTVGTLSKANGLIRDEQMRFYAMLQALTVRDTGEVAAGMLYTMLLRSKRTARAKGPFFKQIEVSYNREDHKSMWLRTIGVAENILDTEAKLSLGMDHRQAVYPTPGQHCEWSCPFVSICHLADDGSRFEDALSGNFVQGDPWAYYENDLIDRVLNAFERPAKAGIVNSIKPHQELGQEGCDPCITASP